MDFGDVLFMFCMFLVRSILHFAFFRAENIRDKTRIRNFQKRYKLPPTDKVFIYFLKVGLHRICCYKLHPFIVCSDFGGGGTYWNLETFNTCTTFG